MALVKPPLSSPAHDRRYHSSITKKALADALKQLMAEKPLQKISVGDICERCNMNRRSFYYHFRDKYDLVNWVFYTEFAEQFIDG